MLGLPAKVISLIEYWGAERKLNPCLLAAICHTESAGNRWAARYEPGYRWLNNPSDFSIALGITHETEEMMQKFSYGLMQIMGGLARDLRYIGPLSALFDPDINMNYASLHISKLSRKYEETDLIAAYNAGSPRKRASGFYENQVYVDKVCVKLRQLRQLKSKEV